MEERYWEHELPTIGIEHMERAADRHDKGTHDIALPKEDTRANPMNKHRIAGVVSVILPGVLRNSKSGMVQKKGF